MRGWPFGHNFCLRKKFPLPTQEAHQVGMLSLREFHQATLRQGDGSDRDSCAYKHINLTQPTGQAHPFHVSHRGRISASIGMFCPSEGCQEGQKRRIRENLRFSSSAPAEDGCRFWKPLFLRYSRCCSCDSKLSKNRLVGQDLAGH